MYHTCLSYLLGIFKSAVIVKWTLIRPCQKWFQFCIECFGKIEWFIFFCMISKLPILRQGKLLCNGIKHIISDPSFCREAYCFTIGGRRAVRLKEKQNWMCRNGSDIILSALVIIPSEDDNSKQGNCKWAFITVCKRIT